MKLLSGNPWRNPAYDWHQFIAVVEGCLEVTVGSARWRVSSHQGLWIPRGQEHTIATLKPSDLRVIYLREPLKQECSVLFVNGLLKELLIRISQKGALKMPDEDHAALYRLAKAELSQSPSIPLLLPWPKDPTAAKAAFLLTSGANARNIDGVSEQVGVCRRTLERRFLNETGMGAAQWRREWRLIEACRRTLDGDRVSDIAFELGYSGSSALIEAFRQKFGAPPNRFRTSLKT